MKQPGVPHLSKKEERAAHALSEMTSSAPLAAMVGMQSQWHSKRSVVALLAEGKGSYDLLLKSLSNPKWRSEISGSVAVIRNSGVKSLEIGEHYTIGQLPWWLKSWYELKNHPLILAFMVLLGMIVSAMIVKKILINIGLQRSRHD